MTLLLNMDKIVELERKIDNLEKRVKDLENIKLKIPTKTSTKLQKLIAETILKLKPQDLVILILFSTTKQTKDEIKTKFKSLGATKKMLNWFNGGNFSQRLINTGIILEDGENKDKKSMYSLTEGKGNQIAVEIIKKLESEN